MAFYVPKLYLNIENLAIERNLEYDKLNKGLGLESMRIPDKHEDAATMAANAARAARKTRAACRPRTTANIARRRR